MIRLFKFLSFRERMRPRFSGVCRHHQSEIRLGQLGSSRTRPRGERQKSKFNQPQSLAMQVSITSWTRGGESSFSRNHQGYCEQHKSLIAPPLLPTVTQEMCKPYIHLPHPGKEQGSGVETWETEHCTKTDSIKWTIYMIVSDCTYHVRYKFSGVFFFLPLTIHSREWALMIKIRSDGTERIS